MDLIVQPSLVERTVFEAARRDALLRPHYERQFAECYDRRSGDERDRAFAQMHERWFNELGLRGLIAGIVNEFAHFRDQVGRLMVTQAPGPKGQAAELFGSPGRYTVVIAVAPAILLDRPAFEYWARHEFLHIDDMLDPAFKYDVAKRPAGATAAARNLAQDRYAVLWAVSVDARLMKRGAAPADVRNTRLNEWMRAFAMREPDSATRAFDRIWEQCRDVVPNHHTLLEWAQRGLPGTGVDAQSTQDPPTAGAACPLCGFPTFAWAECSKRERAIEAICVDFPNWNPDQGLCDRCAEIYQASAGSSQIIRA